MKAFQSYIQTHKKDIGFSVCINCKPCGSSCTFFDNNVTFVYDYKKGCISGMKYDKSLAVCGGECGKDCVTDFRLINQIDEAI